MKNAGDIRLMVLTPQETLFDGMVEKVELPGAEGRFMVLRNHIPLISMLDEGYVVYAAAGKVERIAVVSGFAEVCGNCVTVCAEV